MQEADRTGAVKAGVATLAGPRARRDEILRIAASHDASDVRVVGSVARGDAGADSDIDLLEQVS